MQNKKENNKNTSLFVNILINIFIPYLILTKGNNYIQPLYVLLIALLFPLSFLLFYMIKRNKLSFFSLIGIFSLLSTGIIGILELDLKYLILKEAGIPLLIAFIIILSNKTKYPLFEKFLQEIFYFNKIYSSFKNKKDKNIFIKKIKILSYFLALSFLISSILNYILVKMIVKSQPGTSFFNEEIAKVTALSFPVIAIPSIIILSVLLTIIILDVKKYTNLELKNIIK